MRAKEEKLDVLMRQIARKFGASDIKFFGNLWCIVVHGWHDHISGSSSYGSPASCYGGTLERAAERLLQFDKDGKIQKRYNCDKRCPYYFDSLD